MGRKCRTGRKFRLLELKYNGQNVNTHIENVSSSLHCLPSGNLAASISIKDVLEMHLCMPVSMATKQPWSIFPFCWVLTLRKSLWLTYKKKKHLTEAEVRTGKPAKEATQMIRSLSPLTPH